MADLQIDKKNIEEFLLKIGDKKYIIPDYQRPYAWNEEKCETLWLDIVDAFEEKENTFEKKENKDKKYFLGTIVSYKNKEGNIEIIDGQQRITSLLLLLRAFYKKIEGNDDEKIKELQITELKNSIEKCIWKKDAISGDKDNENIHIESKVATDEQKEILSGIIKGEYIKDIKNNYSKNYDLFVEKSDQYAGDNPFADKWKKLCSFVMKNCIILPIQCDELETAFTIFQTLNDRGMPLSNADIFKAKIYQSKDTEDRAGFIEKWNKLKDICKDAGISLDDIFRYYSHILRAKDNNKNKEIAIRKFYSLENYEKLKAENLISDLIDLSKFWRYINTNNKDDIDYELTKDTQKWFQCLKRYPNEYWKYITSVFFYHNKQEKKSLTNCLTCLPKRRLNFYF